MEGRMSICVVLAPVLLSLPDACPTLRWDTGNTQVTDGFWVPDGC